MQDQLAVTSQREEVPLRIIPGLTAKFLVDLQGWDHTAQLTPPAVAPQNLKPWIFIRHRVQPQARWVGTHRPYVLSRSGLQERPKGLPLLFRQKPEKSHHRSYSETPTARRAPFHSASILNSKIHFSR
jgi:hypothetical protein